MPAGSSTASLVVAFGVGALAGAAAVYVSMRPAPAPARPATDAARPVAEAPRPPPGSGIVSVTLSDGNLDIRGNGVAVAGHNVIVVPLAGFQPAGSGTWLGADGRHRALEQAIAWDFDLGVAVFDVGDAGRDGLSLSADDGSLFLGLPIDLVTAAGMRAGYVDSPAVATPLGGYRYDIVAESPASLRGAALVLPGTRSLVGLALSADDSPRTAGDAIDAGALRDLIAMRARVAPLTVTELSGEWLRSFSGLRARLMVELTAGRWQQAVAAAEELAEQYPQRIDDDIVTAAINAYVNWTGYFLEAGAFARALEVARRGERRFGQRAALRLNMARALVQTGDTGRAAELLHDFLLQNPGAFDDEAGRALREQLRVLVIREATGDAVAARVAIAQLQRALLGDDYAGYHRYLGELLYEQGRYVEAEASLRRAVELDPDYAEELRYALEQSRQRRSTASLIEVPLQTLGNAIFVTVRINQRPELYQFLLDTGATYSAISMRTLLRLGLNEVLATSGTPVQLETANGRVNAGSIRVGSIDLAGAVVEQVPVVVLEELNDVDGLLGLSFLSHFDIEINQRDGKLLLTPR